MNAQDLSDYFAKQFSKVKATKNVLSPLQWFIWPASLACMVGLTQGPPEYRLVFLITLLFCFAYFLAFYAFFAFMNPERLQSEEHRENVLLLAGRLQDSRGPLLDVTPTANPSVSSPVTLGQAAQNQPIAPAPSASTGGGTP